MRRLSVVSATAAPPTAPSALARASRAAGRVPEAALGWLLPALIAVVGGALRLLRLGHPDTLIFDETYYVKEGWSVATFGYEREWPEEPNPAFEAGDPHIILDSPEYVVHPPLGKWLIGWGIELVGQQNPFGWRLAAAVVGALSILLIGVIAWKLLGSVLMGAIASLLLAVDGEHFVHSRTSLLDVFLMFFVLLGFGFLVADRQRTRQRVERALASSQVRSARGDDARLAALASALGSRFSSAAWGPSLGLRPYRIAAGVALGCAMGVKWSGLYALAAFGILTVCWDVALRRRMGVRSPWIAMLVRDSVPAFCSMVPVAGIVYVLSWSGWILTSGGYDRHWAETNSGWWDVLPDWIPGLAHYHYTAYQFHVGLSSEHTYMSNPWGWIVQWRPTSFYYRSPGPAEGCPVEKCSAAITSVGSPVLWGLAPAVVIALIVVWALRRDWRAGAVLAGLAATWAPWFLYQERTIFTFYTIVMVPFVVLGTAYCLGLVWGRAGDAGLVGRRLAVAAVLAAAVLVFAFFWPVHTAEVIPYEDWRLRMWNPTWI